MKNIIPDVSTPGAIKTLILFCFFMAGVEGLEPAAPSFGDRLDNLSCFNALNSLRKDMDFRD